MITADNIRTGKKVVFPLYLVVSLMKDVCCVFCL
jgi:hypothetical protein